MRLINIGNEYRKLFLFIRDEKNKLVIKEVNDFFHYFYDKDSEGNFKSYLGEPLRKIFVSDPYKVNEQKTDYSFESDIFFTKRYIIDKIDKLDKCEIKYAFIDIETLSKELPDVKRAKDPISCISIYNSLYDNVQTYYLGDYKTEHEMIEAFIKYLQEEKFDILAGWNFKAFDFKYMWNRIPDFSKRISPIGKERYVDGEITYPMGTSIIDYMEWDKKITLNKRSAYSLDYVLEEEFGTGKKYKKVEFSKLSPELKARNIEDVQGLANLEKKNHYIEYFDEIRRLSKVEWEDLMFNSRTLDMLLLQEAKKQNIILPSKSKTNEKEIFEGAYREAFEKGAHYNIKEYDLGSCYPSVITNFCLDPTNIRMEKEENCIKIDDVYFKQNKNTLLPTVVKKLLTLKNNIKKELACLSLEDEEYKKTKTKYAAIKSLVNSCYGVYGNRFFRMYNKNVAKSITYLVRNLLHYIREKIEEQGYKVIYLDTDAVFINSDKDLTEVLNDFIKQWAKEKYGKEDINLKFDLEGTFEKLLILARCRYLGYLRKPNGEISKEMCGVEARRKDSTTYMKKFQLTLIDKILNKENKEDIFKWIKEEIKNLHNLPLEQIAFPCKIGKPLDQYKNIPIFVRAMNYTNRKIIFKKNVGDNFYYIYVKPFGYEEKEEKILFIDGVKLTPSKLIEDWELYYGNKVKVKDMEKEKQAELIGDLIKKGRIIPTLIKTKGKEMNVMALDEDNKDHVGEVDWNLMIQRNITNKIDVIFTAMNWDIKEILNVEKTEIKILKKEDDNTNAPF